MIYIDDFCLNEYVDAVDESKFFHGNTSEIKYEDITIPGRDGVVHIDQNRFEQISVEIPCWIRDDFKNRYRLLLNKLNALRGQISVVCTPAPDAWGEGHYTGVFKGAISAPNTSSFMKSGGFTLVFSCNPRWWLKEGEIPIWYYPTYHVAENASSYAGYVLAGPIEITTTSSGGTYLYDNDCTSSTMFANFKRLTAHNGVYGTTEYRVAPWEITALEDLQALTPTYLGNGRAVVDITSIAGTSSGYLYFVASDDVNYTLQCTSGTYPLAGASGSNFSANETWLDSFMSIVDIRNSYPFKAKPLIVFYNEDLDPDDEYFWSDPHLEVSSSEFTSNSNKCINIVISYEGTEELYVDCETEDCYFIESDGTLTNANSYVNIYNGRFGGNHTDLMLFPTLPGSNITEINGSIETLAPNLIPRYHRYIKIYPRWYIV